MLHVYEIHGTASLAELESVAPHPPFIQSNQMLSNPASTVNMKVPGPSLAGRQPIRGRGLL